ncbi:MAG: prolyl oligopeptidase family serine peptidase [Bacteroidaceae bacterium]|nr:prolyl oligopeptidase family serine peptidase [Bacteroidaceae bacterium]
MKKLLLITLALCVAQLLQATVVDENVNITVGGESRNYQLYVPNNVQANCPLVVSLHGAGGSSTLKVPFSTSVADAEGCIVVYPQGKDTAFPIGFGGSATGWTASGEDNFDAKFLKAVIEDVASKYTIDRKRIYCCGFSNGGMMTYAMSNACSDVFAAFASISGYPINEFHLRHTGSRPVPFLHIHGKEDGFVLYSKMPTIVDEMVARLGANPVPATTTVAGKYAKSVYQAGDGSFPYVYYEIDGMGHNDYTANTEDGNSAQTMWNFFEQYTLDSSCDPTLKWRPRIEEAGFEPTAHGWTKNSGTTLLEFGGAQYTTDNKNVYHSLQFESGKYKLCFKSTGETDKTIGVKIQKLTGSKITVLNTTVNVGEEVELPFEINYGWGEYKLTMTRPSESDAINVTNIEIIQTGEVETEEAATPSKTIGTEFTSVDALDGKIFAIVNKAENKAICHKQKFAPYDLQYLPYADAFSTDISGYLFKIESTEGGYIIRSVNANGSVYDNDYFQSNELEKDNAVCFFFALNFGGTNRGMDGDGYAVWDIQYNSEHAAFTLKNVGTDKYYNVPTQAANSDTPGYYTFCEVKNDVATFSINNPANLVNIPLAQEDSENPLADKVESDGLTTYTTKGGICVVYKMLNVDVTDCDYITMQFDNPVPSVLNYSFWSGIKSAELPTKTELKYVFADDAGCEIDGGVIPQVAVISINKGAGIVLKVKGVYKHLASGTTYTRTYSFDKALDFTGIEGLEAYVISSFTPETATLTLKRVKKVPANTGLYLVGVDGDYEIPVIDEADPIGVNLLHASSGTVSLSKTEGTYTNLIFGGTGDNRGFHPLSEAGVIGANKAYLQIPTAAFNAIPASAPLRFVLEDDEVATDIVEVKTMKVADDVWYTLNGLKLNHQPTTKGFYIHNGKKVVIK